MLVRSCCWDCRSLSLAGNWQKCSQHDNWFGLEYGRLLLERVPASSVLFLGSEESYFISHHLIMTESRENTRWQDRRGFDRKHLYPISQSLLGSRFYFRHLRRIYSGRDVDAYNWMEVLLGRQGRYPQEPLIFPSSEEVGRIVLAQMVTPAAVGNPFVLRTGLAESIYRKNFENHGFFVVESFPMPWAQARAIPHGMAYRLADREWPEWMPEIIESDLEYWKDLVHSLMSDSSFRKHEEAGRAFSKLRANLGDLYRIREHVEEAETAYRQALQLWPVNLLACQRTCPDSGQLPQGRRSP